MQWTDSPCINNDSPHPDFYPSQLRRNMNQSTNERAAFPHLRTDQPLESALWGGKPSGIRRSHGGSKIHGHLWLYDVLSMSPVTSKLPELWRKTAPPCQSPSVQPSPTPQPVELLAALNNCNWTAIVSSLEAVVCGRTKVIATDW